MAKYASKHSINLENYTYQITLSHFASRMAIIYSATQFGYRYSGCCNIIIAILMPFCRSPYAYDQV